MTNKQVKYLCMALHSSTMLLVSAYLCINNNMPIDLVKHVKRFDDISKEIYKELNNEN